MDFTFVEQIGKTLLQGHQMRTQTPPDHDAVRIDRLIVFAVPLAGANRTEEAVFSENPHQFYSPNVSRRASASRSLRA